MPSRSPERSTSPGRRCRTGRLVYGKGTFTTSHVSKTGIGLYVGVARPFRERLERIVSWVGRAAHQDDPIPLDDIGEFVVCKRKAVRTAWGIVVCALLVSLLVIITVDVRKFLARLKSECREILPRRLQQRTRRRLRLLLVGQPQPATRAGA